MKAHAHSIRPPVRALAGALLAALAGPAAAQAVFTTIPGIPGYGWAGGPGSPPAPVVGDRRGANYVVVSTISADGSAVAGTHRFVEQQYRYYRGCTMLCYDWLGWGGGSQAFVWSGGSTTGLGYPANATGIPADRPGIYDRPGFGTRESIATAISADGRTVVGYGQTGCEGACPHPPEPSAAFVWTAAEGLRAIPGLTPMASTRALGVSGNGQTVVGVSGTSAFAWTAATGTRSLSGLSEGPAQAVGASFDGRWIIGGSTARIGTDTLTRATLWGPDGRATDLGALGGTESFGTDIAFDGRVAVGTAWVDGVPVAFRWTQAGGMSSLGVLRGQTGSVARAVSGNGNVVVGDSGVASGTFPGSTPFRWTATTGMQSIAEWLSTAGIVLPLEVVLRSATDTNYNGNVVVGTYRRVDLSSWTTLDYSYLARVGDAGSGFIADLDAFRAGIAESGLRTLDAAAALPSIAAATARRQGGWSATLREDSRGCGWTSVTRTRYRNGPEFDAREVGACADAGPVRIAAGAGRLDTEQAWSLGGGSDIDGRYALLGVALPVGSLRASLTGYRGRFDAFTERRYANGMGTDASTARVDGDFRGAVLRFDWTDAVRRGRLGLSPYIAAAWSTAALDPYAETGGGFPVAYEAGTVEAGELALGVFADFRMTDATSIGLGVETSRRRVDTGDGMGAQVIGLFDVSVAGAETDDVDSHVQLRARHALGRGLALEVHARSAVGSEERDIDLAVQLQAAF